MPPPAPAERQYFSDGPAAGRQHAAGLDILSLNILDLKQLAAGAETEA
jgi:hypothetical protein